MHLHLRDWTLACPRHSLHALQHSQYPTSTHPDRNHTSVWVRVGFFARLSLFCITVLTWQTEPAREPSRQNCIGLFLFPDPNWQESASKNTSQAGRMLNSCQNHLHSGFCAQVLLEATQGLGFGKFTLLNSINPLPESSRVTWNHRLTGRWSTTFATSRRWRSCRDNGPLSLLILPPSHSPTWFLEP